uniref:receptor protein-tyrosine kinase n=1 Tax=Latimeria chalumnae TaxID=7897 RepID=M3XGP0_LATCH|nr:PREDICTED: macrophage colony-stimulating factor 1 receptor [Latimeria chalumnae]|eukprot:XP_005988381.1 PREDICTED: macrophage colony-stimulating factor 1 receptor [Latimeria chalumnae]
MWRFLLSLAAFAALGQVWSAPAIFPNVLELVINVGDPMQLKCTGNSGVKWIVPLKAKKFVKTTNSGSFVNIPRTNHMQTGTYTCVSEDAKDVKTSLHVFVKDPRNLFYMPLVRVSKNEGEDAVLPCLVTDPQVSELTLWTYEGRPLPKEMKLSSDKKTGVTIQEVIPSYDGEYVCVVKKDGVEQRSQIITLAVRPGEKSPPSLTLSTDMEVRMQGEPFMISCTAVNPTFDFQVEWNHTAKSTVVVIYDTGYSLEHGTDITAFLNISAVQLSDTGNYTCVSSNSAGTSKNTTFLQVVDTGYVRLSTKQSTTMEVRLGENLELSIDIEAYPKLLTWNWESESLANSTGKLLVGGKNRYKNTLFLSRLKEHEGGQYTFFASNSQANASLTFQVFLKQKPKVVVEQYGAYNVLFCLASGYPAPSIVWYKCPGVRNRCDENRTLILSNSSMQGTEASGKVEVESIVIIDSLKENTTVECLAINVMGNDSDVFSTAVQDSIIRLPNKLFNPVLSIMAGMAVLFLILLAFVSYKYKQKPKYEVRWKIIECSEGNNYTFIDPTQLPYNKKLEFPRDKLRFGKILGSGAFGKVIEATAYGLGKEDCGTRVAVKMLKPSAHSDEKEALMSELKIMSHLGQHEHIVNLLGACTYGGPILVITEYCCYGDLLNFLRRKAKSFYTCPIEDGLVKNDADYKNVCLEQKYSRSDSGFSSQRKDDYIEMRSGSTNGKQDCNSDQEEDEDSLTLNMEDMLRFSYQVAQGMAFLAAKNCIHRDVAARNVLLSHRRVAKICDFGLARDIMNDSNYVVKGNARLPVKWMAPESIFDCLYTIQSDVWSYGILLWEIFSLGKSPYPGMLVDSKFYKLIQSGYQMGRPDCASPEMYDIMKKCWNPEPTSRPTFEQIGKLIQNHLGDDPEEPYKDIPNNRQVMEERTYSSLQCCEETCDPSGTYLPLLRGNNYQFC